MTTTHARAYCVDFLVVNPATTTGWNTSTRVMSDALEERGLTVREVRSNPDPIRRYLRRYGFISPGSDLVEALAARIAVRRATKHGLRYRHVLYMSTTVAMLEPRKRLRNGVVRVDALAHQNRQGAANAILRLLERRWLRMVAAVWSMDPAWQDRGRGWPTIYPLPPRIDASGPRAVSREREVVCYANGPKKRLDIILAAWERAGLGEKGWKLTVAGYTLPQAEADLGAAVTSPHVHFRGLLSPADFRELTRRSTILLAAPDYEDFGIAPLEAIADGCIPITTRSPGPYIALRVLMCVAPELTAEFGSAGDLSEKLRAVALGPEENRSVLRERLAAATANFGEEGFGDSLRQALNGLHSDR